MEILALAAVALLLLQPFLAGRLTNPALQAGATIFVSIVIQALPFLVLGVVLSAAIAAFVPDSFWQKALPKRPGLAVPVAGCAGAVLPGEAIAAVPATGWAASSAAGSVVALAVFTLAAGAAAVLARTGMRAVDAALAALSAIAFAAVAARAARLPGAAPATRTSPESKPIRPSTIFIIVDLPAPLWPKRAMRWPGAMSSDTLSSTVTPAKALVRAEIFNVDVIIGSLHPTARHRSLHRGHGGRHIDGSGGHQGI